ncbi:MAG: hypothetical protein PHV37_01775 [Candidatus Gastranaerophilales bacterium]|nr:hypothetical protein [Candidatus Gastranaerophilales bacterium]
MKSYIYKGDFAPMDIGKDSYILVSGNSYDLPEDNKKVQSLVRQGKLIEEKNKVITKKGAK